MRIAIGATSAASAAIRVKILLDTICRWGFHAQRKLENVLPANDRGMHALKPAEMEARHELLKKVLRAPGILVRRGFLLQSGRRTGSASSRAALDSG